MRLLLITYYFPPCGGAAVQRWVRWLPDLIKAGFEVTVLTTRDGDYPVLDESLLADIPPPVRVLRTRTPSFEKWWNLLAGKTSALPHGSLETEGKSSLARRVLVWMRLNLIIPDLRRFWNPTAYKSAVDFLRQNPIDIVITTGPPHSTHLLGLRLKQRFKLDWVADWRDPWTSVYYLQLNPPSRLSMRLHRRLEKKVAHTADLNLVVSEYLKTELAGANSCVIYNGYDSSKFSSFSSAPTDPVARVILRLKYVGNVTEGQDLEALSDVISNGLEALDFELSFVGTKLNPEQDALLRECFGCKLRYTGFLPHQEALREMRSAHILLMLVNYYPSSQGMLTTKLFEYLAAGKKILCLGPHGGEAEKLILEYSAGACFDKSELDAAKHFLRTLHQDWVSGMSLDNRADVSALSSQSQALKLIEQLRRLKKG